VTSVVGIVLFPGAGSSSTHSSLLAMQEALAPLPVARHDFPYRLAGKPFPDKAPVLIATVKEHVRALAASLGASTSQIVIGGGAGAGVIPVASAKEARSTAH
jgi:uncharacterized protein